MARNFLRDVKVLATTLTSGFDTAANYTSSNTFELNVIDGLSFSQNTETEDLEINESGATPVRGSKTYAIALSPAEFSLPMYIRPYFFDSDPSGVDTLRAFCSEAIMWNALAAGASAGAAWNASPLNSDATDLNIDFAQSNTNDLLKLTLFFVLGANTYRLEGATVNTAEINFDISDLARITFSGSGTRLVQDSNVTFNDATDVFKILSTDLTKGIPTASAAGSYTPSFGTGTNEADYIKTRLSTLIVSDNDVTNVYNLPITGGSITIDNGTTYLTPENLGVVNQSVGSVAGARKVTGNVTCYLNSGTATGADEANAKTSAQLFNDLTSTAKLAQPNNSFSMVLSLGGASNTPKVVLNVPTAQLSVPSINTDQAILADIAFAGQGSGGVEDTDELDIIYVPASTTIVNPD